MRKKVAIIGTGYVGLVTGTCLAEVGHTVSCLDIDPEKIAALKRGVIPIHEPGLHPLVQNNFKQNRLSFTTSYEEALKDAEFAFACVDTPCHEDGSANIERVKSVVEQLIPHSCPSLILVLKSTVPVGTSALLNTLLEEKGVSISIVSNPEFLKEGSAVADFLNPERVVIGAYSRKAAKKVAELYTPLVKNSESILIMDNKSAELSKYACNGMLATKISYMNALACLSENVGADVAQIQRVMGTDSRMGGHISPGIGYGGSCFPKDVSALTHIAKSHQSPTSLLEAVQAINAGQRDWLFNTITSHFGDRISELKVAVWGLSFKPDTDDIREAPAIYFLKRGIKEGLTFQVFDPVAMPRVKERLSEAIYYCDDPYLALEGADCLAICTEWPQFKNPDLAQMKGLMKKPIIFDGRNCLDAQQLHEHGFFYQSVGRAVERGLDVE